MRVDEIMTESDHSATVSRHLKGCIEIVYEDGPHWISHADQPVSQSRSYWGEEQRS